MPNSKLKIWSTASFKHHYKFEFGEVVCSDARDFLSSLNPNSVDTIFLDPPFNLGKKYGKNKRQHDRLDTKDYFDFMAAVLDSACEALKDGGSLFLYHIPKWAFQFAAYLNSKLTFQHWIAISMKNGFVRGPRLYPAHYALLHFSKNAPKIIKRPKVPIQTCRHCGEDVKDYGGYRKFMKNGVNLADVWDDISPVRHKNKKHRKPNELPVAILERILDMSGEKDSILVDPFAGAGTSAVVAKSRGVRFIACDKEKEYFNLIVKRLKEQG